MRRSAPLALAALLCAACDSFPDTVPLSGVVYDAPWSQGAPAPGVTVTTRDASLAIFAQTVTDADGAFTLDVAAQQDLYVELSGDGRATTLFAGETGAYEMEVANGALFVRDAGWADALALEFGDCATAALAAGAGTGVVEGEVRLWADGVDPEAALFVGNAWVTAFGPDGEEHPACYLDAEGLADPDATRTGPRGRFAIFGLPADATVLEVALDDEPEDTGTHDTGFGSYYAWYYKVLMQEDGVAPFYPAWVEQAG